MSKLPPANADEVGKSARNLGADPATQDADRLARAMQTVMAHWPGTDAEGRRPAGTAAAETGDFAACAREYLALVTAWETREAVLLAQWVTEHAKAGGGAAGPSAVATAPGPTTAAVRQRALLVDDSADILILVGAFLADFGFEVLHASSAEAALSILANAAPIDLIVTDHAMPGMTGRDLVVQAREQTPSLQAIIISGYCGCDDLAVLPPGVTLLAKPFRRTELYARIFPARPMAAATALPHHAGSR